MKYLKIMGLCLVAVFLVNVVAVATASAEGPELRAKGGGEIVKKKIKGEGTSKEFVLATEGQETAIKCKKLSVEGEVKSPTEAELTTTFSECEAAGQKCNSEEEKSSPGRIRALISAVPRWSPHSRRHVLLLLTILPRTRQIRINCTAFQQLNVNGGFLVDAGEIEKAHSVLEFKAKQTKGKQELTEFELETEKIEKTTLETEAKGIVNFGKTASGEEAEGKATFEEEVEFRA